MACVITVDGKSYDETGFKQMLSSGFLVNEINAGVLKDSKSEIYKQYVNGDSTKETARGEGEQALQEGVTPEGEGTEIDQAAPVAEAGNKIPGFEQLTDNQKAEFDLALASINEGLESPISAREAFNKLVTYIGPENFPFITNMKSSLSVSLDESYAKNILKGLERDGKTQIKGKFARTPLGRTLLGLAASMRSLGVSIVVLSDEDFNNFLENAYGLYDKDRNAMYSWGAKTIVLRASNSSQVALHEFTHPILEIIEQLDPKLYNSLTTELDKLIHPGGKTYLEWAKTAYAGASNKTIINEALTELISNEADNRIKLSSPASIAANRIWNAIMSFFGIKGAKIDIKIDNTLTVDKLSKAIALAVVSSRALKIQELAGVEQTTAEGIASSKGTNLVSEAGLDKYMTEDGKGNYVFYHVSGLDLTKKGVDPNKLGSNARTGRDEVMAKHPVSMYYTEPDMEEVSGSYKHVVLIPKNKVYPIDSDPLNLRPLAEKEFRKVFPNISFDNNRASSWIAKVAAEKGYDIVVANWSPRKNFKALRAESAIKHKPDLYRKPKPGSLNAVTFNEKYEFESNRNKKLADTQGGESSVGVFRLSKKGISSSKKAPSVKDDKRDFIKDLVEDIDIREFDGMPFVTNMYDYTSAGNVTLGNELNISMMGGKSYPAYMMSLKGKGLGDVSNIAAFNSKAQAESFVRNAKGGNANLFAPHSGGLSSSWQFQQHTFAELVDLTLNKGIFSKSYIIDIFNKSIESNALNKTAFDLFKARYGKNIRNFTSFSANPKAIVDLLDIKKNYSPELRKVLNNAIAADKKFQKAIGVNNKEGFYNKITDPLNKGVSGGEIMSVIKFDPETFEIVETEPDSIDHHPSFGWVLMAKIEGIYQPTEFYQSTDITDSYTKYNLGGEETSFKEEDPEGFAPKNVSSSAGSIPKVAVVNKKGISSSRLSPLPGAPLKEAVSGPDENLVNVAEQYAKDNNIPYSRQPEYVKIDKDLSKRIADAYENMKHDPKNPKVKEAYDDLIKQTTKQYEYLLNAGYKFSFFDSNTDPYKGNPWAAMKDLRDNKRMAVYGTYDGYGTEGVTGANIEDNPMLRDTGYKWKDQNGVEHNVTANDLFRAVHDAFGHGLEGAGFRARGEENAWQAHVRLFTGPAIAAITSETRGQNSWSNYGPKGESNRSAKLEDTVFAEQKTGLMPEWTWTEGRGISSSRSTNVTSKFAESAKLFDQIQEADGSAKKRRLAEERRALIESSPEVKFIDDNIKKIYEQLENKGILTREGNCP